MHIHWPSPVTFDDSHPEAKYARLSLTVPNLTVTSQTMHSIKVNANIHVKLQNTELSVIIALHTGEKYKYIKFLPSEIDSQRSDMNIKKW